MANRIQLRRDSSANWASTNPILAQGELGIESNTLKFKLGDGSSAWNSLTYIIDTGGYAALASPAFTGTPTAPTAAVGTNTTQLATTAYVVAERASVATLTNKTLTDTVYTIVDGASVDLNPVNGGIQVWTLGAHRTATASSFTSGQSLILGINDGSGYSLTFPTITWSKQGGGGSAPTLSTSAYTWIVLWKVGSTLYGSYLGDA